MSVTKVAPSVQDIPEGRVVARSGGGSIQRSDTQSTAGASCSSFSEPSSPQSSSATSVASSPSETSLPRPALLDMDAVHDVATLDLLLGQFESYKSVPQLAPIIPDLMKHPLALEVVLAGMWGRSAVLDDALNACRGTATDAPVQCIRLAFPYTAALFASALDGHYPTLLRRLADAPLLPVEFDRDTNLNLGRCRGEVHAALECLQILADATLPATGNATSNEDLDVDEEDEDTRYFIRQKQGKKKRAQRAAAANVAPALNPNPFRKLNIAVPTSKAESEQAIRAILSILGDELEVSIRALYLTTN